MDSPEKKAVAEIVAFGECMVELGVTGPSRAAFGYAGDTFNTAVYLSRLGWSVAYGTALGDGDPFSAGILRLMADEGLDTGLVRALPGRLPGLYAFDRDPSGERRFYYWRSEAPARDYFAVADIARVRAAAAAARLVYVSGITLAIIGGSGRAALLDTLAAAEAAGAAVAFDPNYRPRLWVSAEEARTATNAVLPFCRHVSASASDLEGLYGVAWPELPKAWAAQGTEVLVRDADQAVTVRAGGDALTLAPGPAVQVVDTTGAGDAFNAGYLSARLRGQDPGEATAAARRLASLVVQHAGAIIPRAAMPQALET